MTEQPSAATPSVEDEDAAERAVQGEPPAADQGAQQAQPDQQDQASAAGTAADESGDPAA